MSSIPFTKFNLPYYDASRTGGEIEEGCFYILQLQNTSSGNYVLTEENLYDYPDNGYLASIRPNVIALTPVNSITLPEIPEGKCILFQFTATEDFVFPEGINNYDVIDDEDEDEDDEDKPAPIPGDGLWHCYFVFTINGTTYYEVSGAPPEDEYGTKNIDYTPPTVIL